MSDFDTAFDSVFGDAEVITVNPGMDVICDDCSADYTLREESGGILFQSKAICPECAPKWIKNARKYNEEQYIRATCPTDKSFANWVRLDLR